MGKFVIVEKSNKKFQFSYKANNGRAVLFSKEFSKREDCLNCIEEVRQLSQSEDLVEFDLTVPDNYLLKVKKSSGEVIAISKTCSTKTSLSELLTTLKTNVANATMSDQAVDRNVPTTI